MSIRINDRMIEAFRAVVTVGTATAAAEIMNTSQSSISRSILRLEEITKVRLFDRVKGRLHLTQEGQVLYEEVESSYVGLERIQQTATALRLKQKGHVGIVCAPVLSYGFISDAVALFCEEFPEVSVSVETRRSNIIAEMMSAQRFDLALAEYSSDPPGVATEIFAEPDLVCIFPKGHRFENIETLSLKDLADEPLIVFPPHDAHRKRMDDAFAEIGIDPFVRVETPMSTTVASMVAKGVGVAVVSVFTAKSFPKDHQIGVRPMRGAGKFTVKLWRPLHRPTSTIVDSFLSHLFNCRDKYIQSGPAP
ncbi:MULTISPECIES: LysR substrate-binding domain-containing protein [Roseobacteraceae]|nr:MULTISPECIES: LysR substrate-binding domain-containing protein [Roseobacteraceae]UWQ75703.1 LysR family transcriptional regulator [Leisingera sp. M658]AFO88349.1 putative transcriptional regulator [Phaeobacter inhibens 2.10]AUQ55134.1 putative transcriptional regulator [Phaeobacter inhibens]AUQ65782.1 putative transcriptional regulator [Phaeobacter inhibens]AUQ79150.1 putative transcriptional regulator [Phaeobacter inhibens]